MWPRRSRLPESVRELDHDRVVAALVVCNVNVSAAAKKLHVSSADLRSLMAVSPDLLALAAEKEERRLDKAESISIASSIPTIRATAPRRRFSCCATPSGPLLVAGVNLMWRSRSRMRRRREG